MFLLGLQYIRWHYSRGIADLVNIIGNFFWFFFNLFSINILLKTFFVPFHRLDEEAKKTFDPAGWVQRIIVNSLMRFVGMLLRTFLIAIGMVFLALTAVVGLFFLVAWVLTPLLVPTLIAIGITFIIA